MQARLKCPMRVLEEHVRAENLTVPLAAEDFRSHATRYPEQAALFSGAVSVKVQHLWSIVVAPRQIACNCHEDIFVSHFHIDSGRRSAWLGKKQLDAVCGL